MGLKKSQREALHGKYDGLCAYCGKLLGGRWHADHIDPVMRITEHYARYNDAAVLALYQGIRHAYASDRSLSAAQKEAAQTFGSALSYFGVDEFPDWKSHGMAIESVLEKRNVKFKPILL